MDTVLPQPGPTPRGDFPVDRTMTAPRDLIPVMLFEDGHGRLVVVDARPARPSRPLDAQLLRIGRAHLALHHLAPQVVSRLMVDGHVVVEGADALNVLLAFANGLGTPTDSY